MMRSDFSGLSVLVRPLRPSLVILAALAVLTLSVGCTVVKPWDRDLLSRPDMAFNSDRMETARRDHVYFAKEATPPGGGAGGGGCGCN
jgi:hypothetical protein